MTWLFISDSQSTGASASVLPMNTQDWFPLGLTGLFSLLSKEFSRVFSNTTVPRHQIFGAQPFLLSSSHIRTWLLGKPQLWLDGPLQAKQCLCFLICCLGLSLLFFQGTIAAVTIHGDSALPGIKTSKVISSIRNTYREVPGGLVVKTPCFHCYGPRFNPW